jgi:hypothetical protein
LEKTASCYLSVMLTPPRAAALHFHSKSFTYPMTQVAQVSSPVLPHRLKACATKNRHPACARA